MFVMILISFSFVHGTPEPESCASGGASSSSPSTPAPVDTSHWYDVFIDSEGFQDAQAQVVTTQSVITDLQNSLAGLQTTAQQTAAASTAALDAAYRLDTEVAGSVAATAADTAAAAAAALDEAEQDLANARAQLATHQAAANRAALANPLSTAARDQYRQAYNTISGVENLFGFRLNEWGVLDTWRGNVDAAFARWGGLEEWTSTICGAWSSTEDSSSNVMYGADGAETAFVVGRIIDWCETNAANTAPICSKKYRITFHVSRQVIARNDETITVYLLVYAGPYRREVSHYDLGVDIQSIGKQGDNAILIPSTEFAIEDKNYDKVCLYFSDPSKLSGRTRSYLRSCPDEGNNKCLCNVFNSEGQVGSSYAEGVADQGARILNRVLP